MDLGWGMLTLIGLSILWVVYYVHVQLPKTYDRRLRNMVRAFATATELRFPIQSGMTERVLELALDTARQMGLSSSRLLDLELATRLRDIGLCSIPYSLNYKLFSEWSEAERATFFSHPEVSAAMLELVPSLRHLAPIVRHHIDGTPIDAPIEARILKAASDYVWMERQFGTAQAYDQLRLLRGTDYCPMVVDAFNLVLHSTRAGDLQPSVAL